MIATRCAALRLPPGWGRGQRSAFYSSPGPQEAGGLQMDSHGGLLSGGESNEDGQRPESSGPHASMRPGRPTRRRAERGPLPGRAPRAPGGRQARPVPRLPLDRTGGWTVPAAPRRPGRHARRAPVSPCPECRGHLRRHVHAGERFAVEVDAGRADARTLDLNQCERAIDDGAKTQQDSRLKTRVCRRRVRVTPFCGRDSTGSGRRQDPAVSYRPEDHVALHREAHDEEARIHSDLDDRRRPPGPS